MALGSALKGAGFSFLEMCAAMALHPDTREWTSTKGEANGQRELYQVWNKAGAAHFADAPDPELLAKPDMQVLRLHRRAPPALPLEVFGTEWSEWITKTAAASACPADYVVAPLLATASVLIGHARWWAEPPHLWCAPIGDSGSGKSPGSDALMRHVLPAIERNMGRDFPDQLSEWKAKNEAHAAKVEIWKGEVRAAEKQKAVPPRPPAEAPPEPEAPRLRQNDVTIEKMAALLAGAAPKGLLIVRDELAGWIRGMTVYNDAGRAFWVEAYGGRPYRVERQKNPVPIEVPRLAVAVAGGTQPDRLGPVLN